MVGSLPGALHNAERRESRRGSGMKSVGWTLSGWRGGAVALLALVCAVVGVSTASGAIADPPLRALAAASCGTDEFTGTALDDARWDVLRTAGSGPRVADGKLS